MVALPTLRRLTALVPPALSAVLSATLVGLFLAAPAPAAAAGGGYVRLAHLVPDDIACDMYLQLHSFTGNVVKYLPSVKYGTISDYVMVPAGTYAIAMRAPGAAAGSKPVLSATLAVVEGRAYTVGRMGSPSNAVARIISDDRTLPDSGRAKLRILQAAQRTLDVSLAGGPVIARDLEFSAATEYHGVPPGATSLRVQPANGEPISVPTTFTAGSVYSLLVLEQADGKVTAHVLSDARRSGTVPRGGVPTGGGGTVRSPVAANPTNPSLARVVFALGLVVVVMLGGGLLASRVMAPGRRARRFRGVGR